ncbi:TetR family transcriptional regulator [Nocardia carnea]|uniref:TetR family transcriptional regulator n=1 Tax=Nocardia carnea TaxID=37328 RepID=UPI002454AAAC|nr:TetR family transcriptional regulator [Nocardia carnea]
MSQPTGLRERKRQATRAAIVRAATELFLDRGFAATSVTDIATAAGVSRRTFFLYFPSKEDVLFHHIEGHIQIARRALDELGPEATPWSAVQEAMTALVDAFDTAGVDELADLRTEMIRGTQGLPASLMIRLQSVHTTLAALIRERFPDPALRPEISAHLGACLGAVAATAFTAPAARRAHAMRTAVRQAGAGFR